MRNLILYIGGSHPQRAAVKELVRAGFEVHVTDRNRNPACAAETPHVHQLDATDVAGAVALAKDLQRRGRLIGAYGIADYAFRSVAAVNHLIGERTSPPDALLAMVDKATTKEALKSSRVPMPVTLWSGPAASFSPADCRKPSHSIEEVMVKPANVHASQGMTRVAYTDTASLRAAVALAGSEGGTVLIEEYVTGDICNLDMLAIDGKALPISMTYRIASEQLAFLPVAQIQPTWAELPNADELAAMGQAICDALGYRNGPFTIDYVRTKDGPRVLEVSPHLHSIALEIFRGNGNPLRAWFRCLAEDPAWRDDIEHPDEKAGALVMLRATETGLLTRVEAEITLNGAPHCSDYVRWKADGSIIGSLAAAGGLVSLGWFVGDSARELEADIRARLGNVYPVVEPMKENESRNPAGRAVRAVL